ncbi:MAG TPA: DJ-1/PfpI family protein [Steroidobacteraceae bacterium]|jgi:cyclohexyl-isocyanide hydratase
MTDANAADLSYTGCKPLSVGMVLFPGFTLLDLAGPQTAFGINGQTHLLWKTMDPVPTDMGVSMNPTKTFAEAPENLDVLFVPGGFGTVDAMRDTEILDFLARAGKTARYITSVCTGSAVLGMAGLLDGYRAATHWGFYEPLEAMGVIPCYERVCVDRNRISGGGVTAGIDFGLTVIATINGRRAAEITQLALEYDPQPPFDAGHPRNCKQDLVGVVEAMMAHMIPQGVELARAYKQRATGSVGERAAV